MKSGEDEFTWERFHNGHYLILNDLFINIDSKCNADLRLISRNSFPNNFKLETVSRLNSLKMRMNQFWEENKDLITENLKSK